MEWVIPWFTSGKFLFPDFIDISDCKCLEKVIICISYSMNCIVLDMFLLHDELLYMHLYEPFIILENGCLFLVILVIIFGLWRQEVLKEKKLICWRCLEDIFNPSLRRILVWTIIWSMDIYHMYTMGCIHMESCYHTCFRCFFNGKLLYMQLYKYLVVLK